MGLIQGSVGLVAHCVTAIKTLSDVVGQSKNASLMITSLKYELGTLQLAWQRIADWSPENAHLALLQQLEQSLDWGTIVMSALQKVRLRYSATVKTFGSAGVLRLHGMRKLLSITRTA